MERKRSAVSEYWTLNDIKNICLIYDIDCLKRCNIDYSLYYTKAEVAEFIQFQKNVEQTAINLIRSNIWNDTLILGKDVRLKGEIFGESPEDVIHAEAFIKLVDEENKIHQENFIIKIHPNIREIVEKRRQNQKTKNSLTRNEKLLPHLKSICIDEITSHTSSKNLMNKFKEEGKKVNGGYMFLVCGEELIVKDNDLRTIANMLVHK